MSTLHVVQLDQYSQYSNHATRQMIWDLVPGSGKKFCPFPNCPDWFWWSPSLIFNAYQPQPKAYHTPPPSTKVKNEWSCLHSHWYALMACTGTTVPLPCTLFFNLSDKHLPKLRFKPIACCQIIWNRCSGCKLCCWMYNKLLTIRISACSHW